MSENNSVVYESFAYDYISKKSGIPRTTVACILNEYNNYLMKRLLSDRASIKFLNICTIKVDGEKVPYERETLGWIANKIGSNIGESYLMVLSVLKTFEEFITYRLVEDGGFCFRGLLRLKYDDGVRSKRTSVLKNEAIHSRVLNSYQRKVGRFRKYAR